jgi:hypothetical protein
LPSAPSFDAAVANSAEEAVPPIAANALLQSRLNGMPCR